METWWTTLFYYLSLCRERNMIIKFEKISGEISPELKFINDPQSNLIMIILLSLLCLDQIQIKKL